MRGYYFFGASLYNTDVRGFNCEKNFYSNMIDVLCIRDYDSLENRIITADIYFEGATDPFLEWIEPHPILADDHEDLLGVGFMEDPDRDYQNEFILVVFYISLLLLVL